MLVGRTLPSIALALLAAGPAAGQPGYTFTRVVDHPSVTFVGDHAPAVNAGGTIGYWSFQQGSRPTGIYTAVPGVRTTIADVTTPGLTAFAPYPALNAGGTAAFVANRSVGGRGIFTGSGGPLTPIADTDHPSFTTLGNRVAINAGGVVAFTAARPTGAGVYTGAGAGTTTVADTADGLFSGFGDGVALNDAGAVAFAASRATGGGGVYLMVGGTPTTIADTDGPFDRFDNRVALSAAGRVAFTATRDAGGRGVYTGTGGATTTIADTTGGLFTDFVGVSINASGRVAFQANRAAGGTGIYTGDGSSVLPVIGVGDPLDGSTVNSLFFSDSGLNDADQVAFRAVLANGREGYYVASFTPVPEPTGLLAAAGLAGAAAAVRRRIRVGLVGWARPTTSDSPAGTFPGDR